MSPQRMIISFIEILYLLNSFLLAVYGFHALYLSLQFLRNRKQLPSHVSERSLDQTPQVTVQLPIYNERHVVKRLMDAVCGLTWPKDRLYIQILDDSTDETSSILAELVCHYRRLGYVIEHVRRSSRAGFKAGALDHGLSSAPGEFIAIFDADFVPSPDFLIRTMPTFGDEEIGCVQTRWGHLNRGATLMTEAQALGIDGHFTIEQEMRHHLGAFFNFNGTAGIWRRRCISYAGGWTADTLTEDLDLSYRAQLLGWRLAYLSDVVVPAELPVQMAAFKRQQFRWAKGSIQTARKLLAWIWRAPLQRWQKVMATIHLTGYLGHPLMLMNLLLILPISRSRSSLLLVTPLLGIAAIGPPLLYWLALRTRPQRSLVRDLGRLGSLVTLGTGLSLNNTKAFVEAIFDIHSPFQRTPKFDMNGDGPKWLRSDYALTRDLSSWFELGLALYAIGLLLYSLSVDAWWMLPWLTLYIMGFGYVSLISLKQAWQVYQTQKRHRVDRGFDALGKPRW